MTYQAGVQYHRVVQTPVYGNAPLIPRPAMGATAVGNAVSKYPTDQIKCYKSLKLSMLEAITTMDNEYLLKHIHYPPY